MWLITPIGFFSVVQKAEDKQRDTLTVRSRVRGDLAALKQHYLSRSGADPGKQRQRLSVPGGCAQ